MADYAHYDKVQDRYVLGPPVFIVSENTVPETTINPAFELGYWRYGLRMAAEWRKRLSLPVDAKWEDVLAKLAPLPVEDGLYVTHEGIRNMWSDFAFEHPALIGTYGMLPGDGVDTEILARTLDKITSTWNFDRTWGWISLCWQWLLPAVANRSRLLTFCFILPGDFNLMNMDWQQAVHFLIFPPTELC